MEKVLFADTFTKTFKKIFKIPSVVVDNPLFRLHYKVTGLALLFASILVTGNQFFGEPIRCIQRDDIPERLLNTYCWIEGTFTLPKAFGKKVGVEVVYPGIEKYRKGDLAIEHSYYQWVCFVLFLQSVMFCAPYILWRNFEAGKMKGLISTLRNPVIDNDKKETMYNLLAHYYVDLTKGHRAYALKFLLCEALNVVNVLGQIFFINRFLGGYFSNYGVDVVKYTNMEQKDRIDPMIRVFPRMTKCTFHRFGSSGDVQKHDALCLLPLNILNEKIFVVIWFWLVILAVLGGLLLIYRILLLSSDTVRYYVLRTVSALTPNDILSFFPLTFGDWFMLYMVAENVEITHFRGFLKEFLIKTGRKIKIQPKSPGKTKNLEIVRSNESDV